MIENQFHYWSQMNFIINVQPKVSWFGDPCLGLDLKSRSFWIWRLIVHFSDSSGIQSSLFSSLARDLKFSDPQYPKQWHLKNQRYIGNDCNVTSVWEYNITGKGVVVAVVDDGNVFVNPLRPKYHQKYLFWDLRSVSV